MTWRWSPATLSSSLKRREGQHNSNLWFSSLLLKCNLPYMNFSLHTNSARIGRAEDLEDLKQEEMRLSKKKNKSLKPKSKQSKLTV